MGRVASRFDLFAEDKQNRIIVDIQHVRYPDHYDRFLHYHCAASLEQISNAYSYRPELKVFTIVVLTSGDRHKKDVAVIDFVPKDLEGEPLGEIPHKILYVCPKYLNDKTPRPYQEWMRAIQDSLDEQVEENDYTVPEVRKIFDYIEKDLISPTSINVWRIGCEEQVKQQKFEEGVKEGIKKQLEEMVKEMLHEGMDVSLISLVGWVSGRHDLEFELFSIRPLAHLSVGGELSLKSQPSLWMWWAT